LAVNGSRHVALILLVIVVSTILCSSCAPTPTVAPGITSQPTTAPTSIPSPTTASSAVPTATHTVPAATRTVPTATRTVPTATRAPLLDLALDPGGLFRIDGKPAFVFSRNIAGYRMYDFDTLLPMAKDGGSRVVRLQVSTVVAGGMGYTNSGQVDEAWAQKWEKVFDTAEANGIYVMIVFTGWYDWNATGFNNWAQNPFNIANGGPASNPADLFDSDSSVQTLWLQWLKSIVTRWQGRKAILAWETYSEVNLTNGVTEASGVAFVERAAAVIRAADPTRRPITASLADVGEWPSFYRSDALDFINIHPYPPSGQLDIKIIADVRALRAKYQKPVMIGESGLSAETPDRNPPTLTTADRAKIGLKHAIWAAVVSGAMNARAFYWEDGYAIYFPDLNWPFLRKYATLELPAASFIRDVDLVGMVPLSTRASGKISGAAIGNDKAAIGWFRDAGCEPPDWPLRPVIAKESVIVTVPGGATRWQIDFYSTQTGTDVVQSITVGRKGDDVTIPLPDFTDDIAFKMTALPGAPPTAVAPGTATPAAPATADAIAGEWTGTITSDEGGFATRIDLSIQLGCQPGRVCGRVSAPELPCSGDLFLAEIKGKQFVFVEQGMAGADSCVSGGYESLQLQADGSLSFHFTLTLPSGEKIASSGILTRP